VGQDVSVQHCRRKSLEQLPPIFEIQAHGGVGVPDGRSFLRSPESSAP
jgi:hypothetical protein